MNLSTIESMMKRKIKSPEPLGSYDSSDVVFLLKDLSNIHLEKETGEREHAIQSGVHYSEMLPVEYHPTDEYMELFHDTLAQSAEKVAMAAAVVAEMIVRKRGLDTVLVSLARAGTPIGILVKRYISMKYNVDMPHYSISIIRGKGIDENAILYIWQQHGLNAPIQFIDGWTGKGAIRKVLVEACAKMEARYGIRLNDDLAVLADPGQCSETYGTREDYLIPSACLNSTVSGLMSRTVLREDLIGPDDFHGAKWYKEWASSDLSVVFVDKVVDYFTKVEQEASLQADEALSHPSEVTWQGMEDIQAIQQAFGIQDVNLIKPGIGETTRVLLRRVPWKILIDRPNNPNLKHIMLLAEDRGVPVEVFPGLSYSCCGIIQSVRGDGE
ncbi:cysteine protease StiP family protein [Paenibacillus sp. JNUCC31]|uniref:cysteine protease StiP family protein n=1 Tax=Paenibacillus sp. JNUCC-31 TaxID=2777983 RepID=UPI00177F584C|nr:cysteine protease StiP family protein [Paenibacillus sp. JNUCC-31]QOS77094.1 cysteine protease StiP family protein [Paenibacillus sp. JNUCC-31]